MPELKLAKLPDRTPVRVAILLPPELHRALMEYSEVYRQTYGEAKAEPITEIIPYMLQDFLEKDRSFAKARKRNSSAGEAATKPSQVKSNG